MSKQNASSAVARRYASALIDTGLESKALEAIEKDMNDLNAMVLSSQDLKNFLFSPLRSRKDQKNALEALADKAKFHSLTKNFLMLLAENRRLAEFSEIYNGFQHALSERRGEVRASVQSAYDLTKAQEKEIQKSLSDAMGQTVMLDVQINKDLIGGMVITVGSRMIDDSVKRKLERLKTAMKSGGANQNAVAQKAS